MAYPNWLKFSPDEKVRYFKDHPDTYLAELTMVRDAYRLSLTEIGELQVKVSEQMLLPKQSPATITALGKLHEALGEMKIGYETDKTLA